MNIENNEIWTKSWKEIKHWFEVKIDQVENLSIENSSNKINKKLKIKMQIKNHANLLKWIFKIKNSMMFYTDEIKHSKTTEIATMQFCNETKATNWTSDKYIDVIGAKLFAIEKAIEFCTKKAYLIKIISDIWIFTDCASAITRLEKFEFRTHLLKKLHRNCKELYEINHKIYIHWILKHAKISRNLQVDEQAKKKFKKDRKST